MSSRCHAPRRAEQIGAVLRAATLPLTYHQIATAIGVAPRTVSVYLSWLKKDGIVWQPQYGQWQLAA